MTNKRKKNINKWPTTLERCVKFSKRIFFKSDRLIFSRLSLKSLFLYSFISITLFPTFAVSVLLRKWCDDGLRSYWKKVISFATKFFSILSNKDFYFISLMCKVYIIQWLKEFCTADFKLKKNVNKRKKKL